MSEGLPGEEEVYRFILDQIDTVPHLEALLLLWNSRPKRWPEEELTERLFVSGDALRRLMQDLVRRRLIAGAAQSDRQYWYQPNPDFDDLMGLVAATYRRELVRISNFIHSKAPSAVREFARAFKFTKERE